MGLALAAVDDAERARSLAWGVPLVAYAALRTVRPLRYVSARIESLVQVLAEVGLTLAVVVATGYWESPYVFALATAILAAGFARGFGFALRTAATAITAVAIPFHVQAADARFLVTVQWATELLLVAIVAGYARRLFGEAEEQTVLARQANDLLAQLHDIAQTLPSSLDLDETVADTVREIRQLLAPNAVAVLLADTTGAGWTVALAEGFRLGATVADPSAIVSDARLDLVARSRTVGVVLLGWDGTPPRRGLTDPDIEALVHRSALAIDNARWFTLLRRVGADEERTRIARDLHDRVGQSLAFVGFELDRISRAASGTDVEPELAELREDVRRVVTEVRDTLYDLRTDVTEEQGLVPTLSTYLDRVADRTGLDVDLDTEETTRLPLRKEREVWRIAQEAVANAVRHAGASMLAVRWYHDDRGGLLEVRDDGRGLPEEGAVRPDAYGVRGMRERAAAIGGRLTVGPAEGGGTLVRCEVRR
ncbi:MAG TPA: sensor histidine kinase [Acidimicrobiales bacterium]|nr:sensor histidine kinase [Acidimicrobiales bacterium]